MAQDKTCSRGEEQRVPAILGTMTMALEEASARLHGISVCEESLRKRAEGGKYCLQIILRLRISMAILCATGADMNTTILLFMVGVD